MSTYSYPEFLYGYINVCIHVHVHTVYVYMYCYIDGGEVVMNDTAHCTLQAT